MKAASANLISLLANSNQFVMWEEHRISPPVETDVLNFSDVFKYLTVVSSDNTDYSSPAFDDSGWASGAGIFEGSSPFPYEPIASTPVGTTIANLGKIWLRRSFPVPGPCSLTFTVYHDDVGSLWVNGESVPLIPSVGYWCSTSAPVFISGGGTVSVAVLVRDSIPSPITAAGVSAVLQLAAGQCFKRGRVRSVIGVEVDTLDLTLLANADTAEGDIPLTQFARLGGFDGATVELNRYFSESWESEACGSLNIFTGRVADADITGTSVQLTVNSNMELLNIKMPRNIFMAQCMHTLYGPGCGLAAAAYTVTGNTTANSTNRQINCNLGQAAGYFDMGTIRYTNGPNAGASRTVKVHTSGVIVPTLPFDYTPDTGDLFDAKPGCDKLYATCNSAKFLNAANFRGYEFIPAPELTY